MSAPLTPVERRLAKYAKAARWKAMGPAIIERPLRLIGSLTNTHSDAGMVASVDYKVAWAYARRGKGMHVTAVGRDVLRAAA